MAKRGTQKTTGRGVKPAGEQEISATGTVVAERPQAKAQAPTHQQIAQRALEIWMRHGCPPGEDKENWLEAERQLKAEMRSR
jgi:hypothetical protein